MKDAKNHLKHVQRKIIQAARKEDLKFADTERRGELVRLSFKRPKNLINKRKIA